LELTIAHASKNRSQSLEQATVTNLDLTRESGISGNVQATSSETETGRLT